MRLHGLFKNAHPGVNANTYMQYNSIKLVEENKYEIGQIIGYRKQGYRIDYWRKKISAEHLNFTSLPGIFTKLVFC